MTRHLHPVFLHCLLHEEAATDPLLSRTKGGRLHAGPFLSSTEETVPVAVEPEPSWGLRLRDAVP